jgi:hypothetical protein
MPYKIPAKLRRRLICPRIIAFDRRAHYGWHKTCFYVPGRRRIALPAAEIGARGWDAGNTRPLGGIGRQYFAARIDAVIG